jgi:phage terminase Nu1 subunit (DNA packaging protein)
LAATIPKPDLIGPEMAPVRRWMARTIRVSKGRGSLKGLSWDNMLSDTMYREPLLSGSDVES